MSKYKFKAENSGVTALFLVQFHIHKGNDLTWQHPQDVDLSGVEYQAICSGLHLVDNDVIYFSRPNGYGVAVFQKTAIQQDRGATMQAFGLIATNRHTLWQHLAYLKAQLAEQDPLKEPTDEQRRAWIEYYEQHAHRGPFLSSQRVYYASRHPDPQLLQPFDGVQQTMVYYLESAAAARTQAKAIANGTEPNADDPTTSLPDLLATLGPTIFVIWKSLLARRRVLLMTSAPPMQQLCHFVHMLAMVCQPPDFMRSDRAPPLTKYSIGINDIDSLEMELGASYIACTSDTIFDIKTDLYDTLIKIPGARSRRYPSDQFQASSSGGGGGSYSSTAGNQEISVKQALFPLRSADLARYNVLCEHFSSLPPLSSFAQGSIPTTAAPLYQCALVYTRCVESIQRACNTNLLSSFQPLPHTPLGSVHAMDDTHAPLLADDELALPGSRGTGGGGDQDATEIDAQMLLDGPPMFASSAKSHWAPDNTSDMDVLAGYFHILSNKILSTLQHLVTAYDDQFDEPQEVVYIGLQDMVLLGLDPFYEQSFLMELGDVYFGRRIKLSYTHDIAGCMCCCQPCFALRQCFRGHNEDDELAHGVLQI
ncbi:hypothetical protein BC940DRAFT_294040 [Gongronella butleri]|nr:hypothetical protein BC940DRAFT_294040 [Gongronella butleri]